jgi:hypothetical protein
LLGTGALCESRMCCSTGNDSKSSAALLLVGEADSFPYKKLNGKLSVSPTGTVRFEPHRGSGCSLLASAYAPTAITAAFSANSLGTILSKVSAAV